MRPLLVAALWLLAGGAFAEQSEDGRKPVSLPDTARQMLVANMNDHQLALHEIVVALSRGQGERAADIAESRLGRAWRDGPDAAQVTSHLPPGMRSLAEAMHDAASEFAEAAWEGDTSRSLAALAKITRQCVACHALYRLQH